MVFREFDGGLSINKLFDDEEACSPEDLVDSDYSAE
jgi:hypothetical protein